MEKRIGLHIQKPHGKWSRQILRTNIHGKFPRTIVNAKSHGKSLHQLSRVKLSWQILTANSYRKFP